jgi:hypothetical protein
MPSTEDQPPGIDGELAIEGIPPPADHPLAADDYGVTAAGESQPESLRQRVARERPDRPQAPPDDPGGRLVDPDEGDPVEGDWADDDAGLSAEESAVHLDQP